MSKKRYDATLPAKSFVIEQLTKDGNILMYDGLTISSLKDSLKQNFKYKMDKWIFKKTNWMDIAESVKVKINEHKELQE